MGSGVNVSDTKLSALVELAATPAADDEVYIRDVSEEASQESKRITVANLLGEILLTPKESSVSKAEGTMFYDSGDDHVYVATE